MRKHKIPLSKVQDAFNAAIKRRDRRCMVRDNEPCCGELECSHFFTVGSSPSLRFYPPNAYAQCSRHHWNHHNRNVPFYLDWMNRNRSYELGVMCKLKNKYIKYTDGLKAQIISLCNGDRLDELKELIEGELGK